MRIFVTAALILMGASAARGEPFRFVAFGDTAYQLPRDAPRLAGLIEAINAEHPAFAIHVGDFKGYSSCSDTAYAQHLAVLNSVRAPVMLTPGDNDWADCSVESAGGFAPLERLGKLRSLFFASNRSLGTPDISVERQANFPENARWRREGVLFATLHVVGPHNGLVRDKVMAADSIDRSVAGQQWLRETFALARQEKAAAVVLAFQVDPYAGTAPTYEDGPLDWLRDGIGEEAATYAGQVLVIHGDSHRFTVDTPYRRTDIDAGTSRGMNVTRLMVPGWPDHRAVRVDVDVKRPGMFGFQLVMQSAEDHGAKP